MGEGPPQAELATNQGSKTNIPFSGRDAAGGCPSFILLMSTVVTCFTFPSTMEGDSSLPEVAIGKRKGETRMVSGQETALPGELLNAVRGPLSYRCQLDLRLLAQECGETDPQSVVITYNSSGHSARSWP